jgi:hypothetical protein
MFTESIIVESTEEVIQTLESIQEEFLPNNCLFRIILYLIFSVGCKWHKFKMRRHHLLTTKMYNSDNISHRKRIKLKWE